MATTEVTPNVAPAAPAAAAPAVSTPAAAESATPAAQPVTEQTTIETPAQPESGFEKDSIEDRIFQTLDQKRREREGQPAAEQKSAEKTEEQKLAEEVKTGEENTEEQKAAEAKAAEQQQQHGLDLDAPDINQKWLDDLIAGKKVTVADDATRTQLFNVVREHGEFKKIADKFPTVEDAQFAADTTATYMEVDQIYQNAHTPEGTAAWLGKLAEMEQANPVLGEDGQPVNVVRAMFDNMREMDFRFFEQEFTKADDQQALAALSILRSRISGQKDQAAGEEAEIPPEVAAQIKAREDAVSAREKALNEKDQNTAVTRQQQFETAVAGDLTREIDTIVNPAIEKAAFSAVTKEDCRNKIFERILGNLKDNRMYKAEKARLFAKGASEENRKAVLAMQMKYFNSVAPVIIRQTIAEYRDPVMKAAAERDQRQKQQEAASRPNPAGAAAAPGAPPVLTVDQQKDKVMADLTKELGRPPRNDEFIARWIQIKQKARETRP